MIVACPTCKTSYNLPDDKVKPEAKLRCTVCKQVFRLGESSAPAPATVGTVDAINDQIPGPVDEIEASKHTPDTLSIGTTKPRKKQSKVPVIIAVLVVSLCIGLGMAWNKTTVFDPVKKILGIELPPTPEEIEARRAAALQEMVGSIGVRNLRQYYITNEKVGRIMVFEGKVANEFDEARELIRVEIELYDETDTLLVSKSQLAGTMVSLFQLQVLDQAELEQSLNNRMEILSNNINIPSGGTVPFMLVFYNPPENASAFEVKIIDARRPESAAQNQSNEQ